MSLCIEFAQFRDPPAPQPPTIEGPYWPLVQITARPTVRQIRDRAAEYFGIRKEDITGPCRTRNLVRPRQIAMYLSRKMTGRSFPEIGRAFGDRDHTTVMHAMRQIERLVGGGCDDTVVAVRELERDCAPRVQFNPYVAPVWPDVIGAPLQGGTP